jgi:surface antigen
VSRLPTTRTLLRQGCSARTCPIALLAALGLAAAAAGPALAGTAPFGVTLSVTAATVSGSPTVTVLVRSAPGAGCTLEVTAAGARRSLPGRGTGSSGRTAWRWHWRPGALKADAPWRFTATCRIGTLWSRRWVSFEPGFPAAGGALAPSTSVARGTPGASCDGQGLCFADDPFPSGQCTWYAAGRRPDLLGIVSGNAGSWLAAGRGRVAEGWYPVVGALAVWLPFHAGAGADGHVAYVAAVSPDGQILVDDSNWRLTPDGPGLEVHEHRVSSLTPSGYIYGGPAGAGPAP